MAMVSLLQKPQVKTPYVLFHAAVAIPAWRDTGPIAQHNKEAGDEKYRHVRSSGGCRTM